MYIYNIYVKEVNEISLPEPISFEWDSGNFDKNLKHSVHALEAEQVFFNKPLLLLKASPRIGIKEIRYIAIGKTYADRILFLAFTIRKKKIRIISVRDASKKERKIYEET